MLSCSGVLASSVMGWPSIFYFSGAAGGLWSILWFFFGSNSPSECKSISTEEKDFIETSLKPNDDATQTKRRPPTPWREIFTSMPFIALFIVHAGQNWGYWTLLTKIPVYMKFILGFDIKSVSPYCTAYVKSSYSDYPIANFRMHYYQRYRIWQC